jgi:hypothetical protein
VVYHFTVVASREELTRAEVEAWHRTHYRLDWLLYRTIGYALLSSTLAIYVFWAETGSTLPLEISLALAVTWIVLLGFAMLWYDFHTRVSYETWPEVRRRLSRHITVSLLSFAGAFVIANGIHGVSVLIDRASEPTTIFSTSDKGPEVPPRPVRWRKGGAKGSNVKANAAGATTTTKKPEAAVPKTGASTKTVAKAPTTAKVDPKAKAPTAAKPTVKKSSTSTKRRTSNRRNRYRST